MRIDRSLSEINVVSEVISFIIRQDIYLALNAEDKKDSELNEILHNIRQVHYDFANLFGVTHQDLPTAEEYFIFIKSINKINNDTSLDRAEKISKISMETHLFVEKYIFKYMSVPSVLDPSWTGTAH